MLKDFIDIIFPRYCQACLNYLEKGEHCICTTCRYELPRTHSHQQELETLKSKFWGRVPIEYSLAYLKFTKEGRVQRLLHKLKYSDQQEVGEILGKWYGYELAEGGFGQQFDLILPVPLHPSKLKKRGYNQSDCFAKGLSEGLEIDWSATVLGRKVNTATQTKKKRLERWTNVDEVFSVDEAASVKGRRILLVDDVITTGATLEACAQALLAEGCRSVSIATIAVAV